MKVKRLMEILKNCPEHYDVYYFGMDDDNNREINCVETLVGYGEVVFHEDVVKKLLDGMIIEVDDL